MRYFLKRVIYLFSLYTSQKSSEDMLRVPFWQQTWKSYHQKTYSFIKVPNTCTSNFSLCFPQYVLMCSYHCTPNTQLSCWCSVTELQNAEIVSLFWFIFSWKKSFSVKADLLYVKLSITSKTWNSICRKDISINSSSLLKYLGSRRLHWEYKMGPHLRVSPICRYWLGYSVSGFTALRRFVSSL